MTETKKIPLLTITTKKWATHHKTDALSIEIILKDFRSKKHIISIQSNEKSVPRTTKKGEIEIVSEAERTRIINQANTEIKFLEQKLMKKYKLN